MRYEAKHKYFKQLANTVRNVINLPYTLAVRAVNNHWDGQLEWLLEWTTGLTFFELKIIFMACNEIPLPVKLHPQSVIVSTIALHSTKRRQPVSNSCDGYSMNSSIPKALEGGGSREYKAIA